jgi:1-acyl-sn-glycerol-3-phosphate acyltransferase
VKFGKNVGGQDRSLSGWHAAGRWADQQSVPWYRFTYAVLGLFLRFWIRRFRAVGVEHVPKEGGVFLVANHESGMDPFVIGYPIPWRMIRGPGKLELFANPIGAYYLKKIGMFPLRQDIADSAAVRAMVELYRKGRVVLVYPEGGRSVDGQLQPFFPDFARLMIRLKARMIPVGVDGTYELMPMHVHFPRFNSPVVVAFGEEFDLNQFYGGKVSDETAQEAAILLREKVAAVIGQAEKVRAEL